MKKIIQHSQAAVVLAVLCAVLSSFAMPGAHSFQLYVDSKMVAEQYVTHNMSVPKLTINPADHNDAIIVKYSECNRTVSGRTISIKDEQDKVLKEWRFNGTTSGYKDPMTIQVKEITALKPNKGTLKLFYSSNDFKEGQQIAALTIGKDITLGMK